MGATYLDAAGQPHVIQMGCYGIGVTRVVAAAIEQNHDERGIVWPAAMAPFSVAIAPIGYERSEGVKRMRRPRPRTSSPTRGSTCCWTTGASGLA